MTLPAASEALPAASETLSFEAFSPSIVAVIILCGVAVQTNVRFDFDVSRGAEGTADQVMHSQLL